MSAIVVRIIYLIYEWNAHRVFMVKVFELSLSAPASRNFFYRIDSRKNIQFWQILQHHHLLMVSLFWYFLGIFSLDTLGYRVYSIDIMRES